MKSTPRIRWMTIAVALMLAALLGAGSGCDDRPTAATDEQTGTTDDAKLIIAFTEWLSLADYHELGFAQPLDEFLAARGISRPSPGIAQRPVIKLIQRGTGYNFVDVALQALQIPECGNCFDRRCWGFEANYWPGDIGFAGASKNPMHEWALFGWTPPGSQWELPDGRLVYRVGAISFDATNPFEEYPRLAMMHFGIPEIQNGGFTILQKTDNTDTSGWCLMDGTPGQDLEIEFLEL
jgi:hypothetical protein